jgi:hypothetical protein
VKVIYAPFKAFKEITQNPKYLGPILILILFVAVNIGYGYAILSRSYIEKTLPSFDPSIEQFDVWTENATLWTSIPRANITEDFNDFINGSYYGNRSIAFSIADSSKISMELMKIGPANCSSSDGYKNMSLKIKVVHPTISPSNASIYLFSGSNSSYFYYNLKDVFSDNATSIWNNLTIPLATENWVNKDADWSHITGIKLEFSLPENSNISILVDGLFFRGIFQTPLDTDATTYMSVYAFTSLVQFVFRWVLMSGIIVIITRAFGTHTARKPILVSVGFAFIFFVVQTLANTVIIQSTLPNLYYSLELLGGTPTEIEIAATKMSDATGLYFNMTGLIQLGIFIWIDILCAIATRLTTGLSWAKSMIASAIALFAAYLIGLFFGF